MARTLDAASTERTMLLACIYRRGQQWRVRAIGQGCDVGLANSQHGMESLWNERPPHQTVQILGH
jgi:stress response protein SCP2